MIPRFLICFCSILIGNIIFPETLCASLSEDISSANQTLAAGHYKEALPKYESLLASPQLAQFSSPEIWFHRGLAEEKSGNAVAASLSFRRALLLDPSFSPARAHLASVLGALGASSPSTWQDQFFARIHPDTMILGGAIFGWIGMLGLVFLLLVGPRRPALIALAITACLLGHGLSILGTMIDPRRVAENQAVVTAKSAPTLHDTPADQATTTGTLPSGSLITVLSRNGVWWYVFDGSGHLGWIPSTALTPLLPRSAGS
jgi:hypothetical protein